MIGRAYMRCLVLIYGCFLLIPTFAVGQDLSFEASVDRTHININQNIVLTVTVSGSDLDEAPAPSLPDMPDFILLGRTSSTSSNISIVNSRISRSRTIQYIYSLQPRQIGQIVIDPALITYNGKTYRTTPITIQVSDAGASTPNSPPSTPRGRTSPGRVPPPSDKVNLGEELFVRANVDKKRVYLGEQVTVTYTLYTRVGLSNVQYGQLPSFTGFWMEELFSAQHLDFTPKVINGKRYNTAMIKRVALFPTVSGNQEIEPLSIVCDVPGSRRRGLFDSFFDDPFGDPFDSFFSRSQRTTIQTTSQTVEVMPLPVEGRPEQFSGGVGQFSIRSSVDMTETEVSQPLTLTVVLSGTGNLKTVNDPVFPDLPDFKQYASSSTDAIKKQNARVSGEKKYSYVLIPLKPGEHRIAPIPFSYFDSAARTYKTISTDPITVTVTPGDGDPAALAYASPKAEVKQIRQDIQYIKPETDAMVHQGGLLYRTPWFLLLQAIPIVAIIGAAMYKSHALRLQKDVGYARWRRAHGEARRELQQAERVLKKGGLEQTFTHISNTLQRYIGDKCNVPETGLTSQQISDLLKSREIPPETVESLISCLDACDMARFAPTMLRPESTREVLDSAKQVIVKLEQHLVKTP